MDEEKINEEKINEEKINEEKINEEKINEEKINEEKIKREQREKKGKEIVSSIQSEFDKYNGENAEDEITTTLNEFLGYDIVNVIDYKQLLHHFPNTQLPEQSNYFVILFQLDPFDYMVKEARVMTRPSWRDVTLYTDLILFISTFYNAPIPLRTRQQIHANSKQLINKGIVLRGEALLSDIDSLMSANITYGDLVPNCVFNGIHRVIDCVYSVSLKQN